MTLTSMILHSRFVRLIRNTFGSAAQKTPLSGSSDGSRINAIHSFQRHRDRRVPSSSVARNLSPRAFCSIICILSFGNATENCLLLSWSFSRSLSRSTALWVFRKFIAEQLMTFQWYTKFRCLCSYMCEIFIKVFAIDDPRLINEIN